MLNITAISSDEVLHGILAAMTTMSLINLKIWNPKQKPVNDMLVETKPDYMLLPEVQDPYILDILAREQTPIIQYGNHRNLLNNKLLCTSRPVTGDAPDIMVGKAANVAQYFNGTYDPKLACDVAYISNTDTSTRPQISYCLQKLINADVNIKIAGKYSMPFPQYLGTLTNKETANLIRSAKFTLDFDIDLVYDIFVNDGSPLEEGEDADFQAEDVVDQIQHYINDGKLNYTTKSSQIKNTILSGTTYHHTVAQIFTYLNRPGMSQHALNTLEKIVE